MAEEAIYSTQDPAAWRSVLPAEETVFGSVEFAKTAEEFLGHHAQLYVLLDGDQRIAYPFFLRSLRTLDLPLPASDAFWDTCSMEFTGPIARGTASDAFCDEFRKRFSEFALRQGIVAEFAHLHPWKVARSALLPAPVQFDREIVFVDLTLDEQQLWERSFTHACRKNINRARRENVRAFEARTPQDIAEFYRIYVHTMHRRQAQEQYYFSLDYFRTLFERLRDHARFVLAAYRNQVVAATLYLHDRDDVYSYLGGADESYQQVRPTNAVVHDTILWGQRQGKKRLILGGGYLPEDGIFRFKASFSPARKKFDLYKQIHQRSLYEALCTSWSLVYGRDPSEMKRFPAYRCRPESGQEHESVKAVGR